MRARRVIGFSGTIVLARMIADYCPSPYDANRLAGYTARTVHVIPVHPSSVGISSGTLDSVDALHVSAPIRTKDAIALHFKGLISSQDR